MAKQRLLVLERREVTRGIDEDDGTRRSEKRSAPRNVKGILDDVAGPLPLNVSAQRLAYVLLVEQLPVGFLADEVSYSATDVARNGDYVLVGVELCLGDRLLYRLRSERLALAALVDPDASSSATTSMPA